MQGNLKKIFSLNFEIFGDKGKKLFSKIFKNEINYPRKVDIFGEMYKQLFFQNYLNKNLIFFEMLILSDIWTKNDFSKCDL